MRYFKYDGPWADIDLQKRKFSQASTEFRTQHRKYKQMHRFRAVVFLFVVACVFVGLMALLQLLNLQGATLFERIIIAVIHLAWGFGSVIISIVAGSLVSILFWKPIMRRERNARNAMHQALAESCSHLRVFYGLQEPCLVTKCYCSSDQRFSRHDICLFVVENELRITANLETGFIHPRKDLGCYALTHSELQVKDALYKEHPAVEIQADGISFCMGQKAKAFIIKNFSENIHEQKKEQ